jgi:predicted RNA-binding Zn-ribbon protein involved in translation (DUF1610 family)
MFLTYCRNCKADVDPVLNTKSDEVVCPMCGEVLPNMSSFIKIQLKAFGQVKKVEKPKKAFSVKCKKCEAEAPPRVKTKDLFVCAVCGEELILMPAFKNLVLENIKPEA